MARSTSGRVVIEVDPELKAQLYAALARDGLTLKDWFVRQAEQLVYDEVQLALRFNVANESEAGAEQ